MSQDKVAGRGTGKVRGSYSAASPSSVGDGGVRDGGVGDGAVLPATLRRRMVGLH